MREGDEQRAVLSFPPIVAPTKALIVPISKNESFEPFISQIGKVLGRIEFFFWGGGFSLPLLFPLETASGLRKLAVSNKVDNSTGSIGKRYARNDELGTPFAVTIDFQTVTDSTVTIRERDSTNQIRVSIPVALELIKDLTEEKITWKEVSEKYPPFSSQEIVL